MKNLLKITCLGSVTALAGCSTTDTILQGVDAGCADIEIDGYFTDSRARGRIIKYPEGQTLDAEAIRELCNQ